MAARALPLLLLVILLAALQPGLAKPATPEDPAVKAKACGYASCPATQPGMLNVHLVPHTHDDVGWLKTVDQYFYGSRNEIQKAGVQYIIDSVVSELSKDPARRFIYVETAFFWQWWLEQNDAMRAEVTNLVDNGRLEFISGAWSMNDEATTHYHSIVDQFTWGLRKLNDTFGECGRPRVGWQIDPFGHARETASMFAHMGFDGMFFARLDYQDFDQRKATNTSEFIWEGSPNLGDASDLFTSILYYFYMAPPNFCFDIECNDAPIIDNPSSPDYNVDARIDEFIAAINKQAQFYKSGHLIMAMGGDFNYQQADTWYKNIDKLIKYINAKQAEGGTINLLYSTPSCYLKALHDTDMSWSTKQDDFFPYSSDPHAFWTGYYTSRPTLKFFERQGNNFLQVCKQLHALAGRTETTWEELAALREVMGVMQHHDAITGTEKQHVAEDYALRLGQAFEQCQVTVEDSLNTLMKKQTTNPTVALNSCLLSNISSCDVSESSDTFVVTLYNPLGQSSVQLVRLPVSSATHEYTVWGPAGEVMETQLVPILAPVLTIPGRSSSATHELVFRAADLPPLGFNSYYVQKSTTPNASPPQPVAEDSKYNIGNKRVRAELDPATGLLKSVRVGERAVDVEQNFFYYDSAEGNNEIFENRSSGAYIFRPLGPDATPVSDTAPTVLTYTGPIVDETHQIFSDWVSQVIRVYHDEAYLEMDWLVGPIPTEEERGKEVITRFSTGWATDGVFFTDSNGREMLERKRDFRATWNLNLSEPVAGNYYPVTTAMAIKNSVDSMQLSVLADRAQGGSSINDGELELMVHRRCLRDDAFGVGEALNEIAFDQPLVARGRHLLVMDLQDGTTSPSATAQQRQLTLRQMVLAPWALLTPTTLTRTEWTQNYRTQWSGLVAPLPDNVHLLTLESWREKELLLRLEHFLEMSDDSQLSNPASVTVEGLFSELRIGGAKETTLAGNQWLEDSVRLEWTAESAESKPGSQQLQRPGQSAPLPENRLEVVLEPMQIRTFVLEGVAREASSLAAPIASTLTSMALVTVALLVAALA